MSKQDIKKAGNRTWDVVNLIACATGGAMLTFATETPTFSVLGRTVSFGQVVGAVLLSTAVVRIAHLVYNEERK